MSRRIICGRRRRAATVVAVAVFLPVLFGFAAITLDVGVLYNTRADLQNAADAGALAAAHTYATPTAMHLRMGMWSDLDAVGQMAIANARRVVSDSPLFGGATVKIEDSDVSIGWIDVESASSPFLTDVAPSMFNAVRVITRCGDDSANGPATLFFSGIFGKYQTSVSASAVAVLDDHFSGLDATQSRVLIWPFSKEINDYTAQLTTGGDAYAFDPDSQSVVTGSDGSREVILYPGNEAPGNYGLLNIGSPSMSSSEIAEQLEQGITTGNFEATFGSAELIFFDSSGDPTPYIVPANPGLKAMLEDTVQLAVGDFVGFFVHDLVQFNGANTTYRVVGMRFGRVMHVSFQSSAASRGLWIQPMTYDGPGVMTTAAAPSSQGAAGVVVLTR